MRLSCLGVSHHEAPVALREKIALTPERLIETHAWAKAHREIGGFVVLSTCNRTEFYQSNCPNPYALLGGLFSHLGIPAESIWPVLRPRVESEAARHLFRVASGLDSMMIGETEIFGQTKEAYAQATRHGRVDKLLHRLFQSAFRAGKQVREETAITRGSISVASAAVELATLILGDLSHQSVLLLGAGDTCEKVARTLVSTGIQRLTVANRTLERAQQLALQLGGHAIPFEQWQDAFLHANILISSTAADHAVITAAESIPLLKQRRHNSLFLIDLAVPRDIDPLLGNEEDVYLYNIDDLQTITAQHMEERRSALAEADRVIARHVTDFLSWRDRTLSGFIGKSVETPASVNGGSP